MPSSAFQVEHRVQTFSQPCPAQREVPKAGTADLPSQTSRTGSAPLLTAIPSPLLCWSFEIVGLQCRQAQVS